MCFSKWRNRTKSNRVQCPAAILAGEKRGPGRKPMEMKRELAHLHLRHRRRPNRQQTISWWARALKGELFCFSRITVEHAFLDPYESKSIIASLTRLVFMDSGIDWYLRYMSSFAYKLWQATTLLFLRIGFWIIKILKVLYV